MSKRALITGITGQASAVRPGLISVMRQVQPTDTCSMAAQRHRAVSFEEPDYTSSVLGHSIAGDKNDGN